MTKDPVCGMMIAEQDAIATASYGGKEYHFCSHDCHATFLKNPAQYADKG